VVEAFPEKVGDEGGNDSDTQFRVEDRDGFQIVEPSGDLLGATADRLRTLLLGLFDAGNHSFRFNLGHVKSIDSVNFSVFLVFAKMLLKCQQPVRMEIVGASSEFSNLFHLTHMDEIYRVAAG